MHAHRIAQMLRHRIIHLGRIDIEIRRAIAVEHGEGESNGRPLHIVPADIERPSHGIECADNGSIQILAGQPVCDISTLFR